MKESELKLIQVGASEERSRLINKLSLMRQAASKNKRAGSIIRQQVIVDIIAMIDPEITKPELGMPESEIRKRLPEV